jgi:hypothetical protein
MYQGCQTSSPSSECVYIEHELAENAEKPDFCSIMIAKKDTPRVNEEANHKCEDKDGEREVNETPDSSSIEADFGDSDDEMTDVDIGDVDLDDILEAERTEDKDGRQILREFEHGNIFGDEVVGPLMFPPTRATPHFPPGLKACRDPPPFFGMDWDIEETETSKTNGVEVRMQEVDLTDAEIDFYFDRVYGFWRARQPSRLRVCWIPVEVDEEG